MTRTASTATKVLRVGIIQGGKIIEERHIRRPGSVSVGQDAKNTFVIPASNLPPSFPVFDFRGTHYYLLFTERMEGRVRIGDKDVDFATLRSKGMAQKRGSVYALQLNDTARGKVALGEITLLFQFVPPRAAPARMALPAEFRGTVWSSLDHLFFAILAASLVVNFSGAACIALSPKPPDSDVTLDEMPDRFAKLLVPPKAPEPEKPKEEPKGDEEVKKEPPKKNKPASEEARKAAIAQKVQSKGILKILGASGGQGALRDLLGEGTGSQDVASALKGAQGGVVVATTGGVGGPRGGGAGSAAGIGDVGTAGGGNVSLGAKGDARVSGKVAAASPEVDSADVDREALARYIKARLTAIRGCYEKELKRNPTLKGKVVVRFNITPAGRAGDIRIEENSVGSAEVGLCIASLMRSWVFPFKPPDEVAVQYPFLFTASQ
jgi:TonB family protein